MRPFAVELANLWLAALQVPARRTAGRICYGSRRAGYLGGVHSAVTAHHLPHGLLTRAWHLCLTGDHSGARADLAEAWEIAERGPMPLYQVDIHLTRARLFGRPNETGKRMEYPWESVEHDLKEARRLIEKHGYHCRDGELADAAAALLPRPSP